MDRRLGDSGSALSNFSIVLSAALAHTIQQPRCLEMERGYDRSEHLNDKIICLVTAIHPYRYRPEQSDTLTVLPQVRTMERHGPMRGPR